MSEMDKLKEDVKQTAQKAQFMAKEVAKDVKDDVKGAVNIMEEKVDDIKKRMEEKKFEADIKHQMKKEGK